MRWVRHRPTENKRLFPYHDLETYSDCDELIICLSERSLNIILNALKSVEEMRTRVWTTRQSDFYEIATDEQFEEFRQWMSDVYNQLGSWVMCNEKLERIATALEEMNQRADEETINLFDLAEVMGIEPTETEADILELLDYIVDFSDLLALPSFKIPKLGFISSIMESRYKSAHLQLLRDISISQRGQTVAQGGIDFAALYDTMGETADSLIVKAGFEGKMYWLWRWLDNDQIPGWLGWISTISGLVLGSIRGAAYDLVDAVTGLDLAGIEQAIQDQTITAIVNCNNSTFTEVCNHLAPEGQPFYVTDDRDADWTVEEEPPSSDTVTWSYPSSEDDRKCQAANFIIDWLQAFYGHSDWNLSTGDNLITLSDKAAAILAELPPIGVVLNGLSSLIGMTLAYLSGGSTDIFETVNEKITDRQDDLRCVLYNATTSEEARQGFLDIMEEESLNSLALNGLDVFLTMNNVMANLWFENDTTEPFIEIKEDDNCDCGTVCSMVISQGSLDSGDLSGNFVVSSVAGPDVGGAARYWIFLGWSEGCSGCQQLGIASDGYTRGNLATFTIGNLWYECEDEGVYTISQTNTPDDLDDHCFYVGPGDTFVWNSRTPFTVTITGRIDCP